MNTKQGEAPIIFSHHLFKKKVIGKIRKEEKLSGPGREGAWERICQVLKKF